MIAASTIPPSGLLAALAGRAPRCGTVRLGVPALLGMPDPVHAGSSARRPSAQVIPPRRGRVWLGMPSPQNWVVAPPTPGLTGFIESTITEVFPPIVRGGQVFLCWTSSAPAGTWFQVYINDALAWHGQSTSCWVPVPSGPVHIDIATVGAGEEQVDSSLTLPPAPSRRAELSWLGGTFEGADIAGFRVYGERSPGTGINYAAALADITAYPAGIATDGLGLGGFGTGGFGAVAGTYTWTSGPLDSGTWSFAVQPYDAAGNLGAAVTVAIAITAPPREPGWFPDGVTRLVYTILGFGHAGYGSAGFGLPEAVLTWQPSPS